MRMGKYIASILDKDTSGKSAKSYLYGKIILAVATAFSILLFYFFMAEQTDRQMRSHLLLEARTIAGTLDIDNLAIIPDIKSEINAIDYLKLKNHFTNIRNVYRKSVNIYLIGRKPDGTVFFFIDNHPTESGTKYLPGQVYKNVPPEVLGAFEHERAVTLGPVAGRRGEVVTALVPIFEHHSEKLIALIGMDVDFNKWNREVSKRVIPFVGLFALLTTLLIIIYIIAYQRRVPSTQRHLLIPLTLILVIFLVGFCVILLKKQSDNLNQLTQEKIFRIYHEFNHLIAQQSNNIITMEDLILSSRLRRAMEAGDKEFLMKTYGPLFAKLKKNFVITHFYLHRPDLVSLLRIHNPKKSGDLITRFTAKEAKRTRKVVSGVELGRFGTLTLRVVKPIFDGNVIVGYLELGKEIDDILATLQSKYAVKLTVTVYKKELDRKDWEIGMKMLGRNADWNRYKNEVIISSSLHKVPSVFDELIKNRGTYYAADKEIEFDGKHWKAMTLPFIDVAGANIGNFIILKDISSTNLIFKQLFFLVAGCTVWILIVTFLYTILRHADKNILKQQMELAKDAEKNALQQGRIETANNILHDIGNAMAGVSSYVLKPQMDKKWQEVQSLYQLSDLFESNEEKISEVLGKEKQHALDNFMKALINSLERRRTEYLDFLEKISGAVAHVCSVLELQKRYLREKVMTQAAKVNLPDIISDTIVMMSGSFQKRNIKVSFEVESKNINISGDQTSLVRVFLNIMKNTCEAFDELEAIKDKRKLKISVTSHKNKREVKIVFSDNGIGFAAENIEKIFERGFTSKANGSGIGLHECRLTIESYGGTITMSSNGVNTGAKTIITLPILK